MTQQVKHVAVAVSFAFAWIALAIFTVGLTTPAKSAKSTAKTKTSAAMMTDTEFATAAAEGGVAQIRLGELAEDKASSKAVKDLGERLVQDHTRVDDQLKSIADKDDLSIPVQMNAKDQATYAHLSELSGAAFDRAYTRDIVRDHEADIAAFRHEADEGKNASIKGFAAKNLPTLEDHLKLARQALEDVSPKTSAHSTKTQKKQS